MRLFDAGGRWNADDDVGEVLARGSAHAQPPQLNVGNLRLDRRARGVVRAVGNTVREDVHVLPDEP